MINKKTMEKQSDFNEVLQDAIQHYENLYKNQKWYWFLNKHRIKKAIKHLKKNKNV